MRILQLPSWYLPEGGYFCLHQSVALQEAGVDVHILANVVLPWRRYKFRIFSYPISPFFSIESGIPIYRYYSWKYPFVDIPNIEKWAKKTVRLFDEYTKKNGLPDIIHAHSSMWGGYAAALIKEKYGIPYVITEHRGIFGSKSRYAQSLFREKYNSYLEKAFSEADFIIPVSEQLIEKINQFSKKSSPIKAISNILDTNYFHYVERNRDSTKPFCFVSVNGYWLEKGYDILFPAFDKLCEQYPDVRLRIVGENFDNKTFKEYYKQIQHKDKISFAGEVNRNGVRTELEHADAFVIASRVESQSIATLEAMSTGLPIVATSVIPGNLIIEKVGYLVPIENHMALTDAMLSMIKNYNSFNGKEISNHVYMIAGKEIVSKKLIEIYKKVLSK